MKTKIAADVPEYISAFPKDVQKNLKALRAIVKKSAPKAEEAISYGVPGYKFEGVLLYFAAFKKHIGFYAMPSAIKAFEKDLKKYEVSKGTIRFPLDEPLPLTLIAKIIKFRVKENLEKKKAKEKSKIKMFS